MVKSGVDVYFAKETVTYTAAAPPKIDYSDGLVTVRTG